MGNLAVPEQGTGSEPPDLPILRAIDEYLTQGLKPIPLRAKGEPIPGKNGSVSATGKEPIGSGWGRKALDGLALRRIITQCPKRGIGIQLGLGPAGEDGVFDLEIDDEYQARPTLLRIFGQSTPPETRRYRSRRGMHHIYRLTANDAAQLRARGITQATIDGKNHPMFRGIELRFGTLDPDHPRETQSVAPPTPYERDDGVVVPRQWEGTTIAPFPAFLLTELISRFGRMAKRQSEPPPPPRHLGLSPIEMFLHQIEAMGLSSQPYDGGWSAQCPAHPDNKPSLSVRAADDGRLLVHCFGCGASYAQIMAATGLESRDGFSNLRRSLSLAAQGLSDDKHHRSRPRNPGNSIDEQTAERLAREHERSLQSLMERPDMIEELAQRLHVSHTTLAALGVGWREDRERRGEVWAGTGHWAWVFPEVDGRGRIVGLLRRYEDDRLDKKLVAGGRRGLTVPATWRDLPGPIILCEGASDTAALLDLGFCAIGRPQARARCIPDDLAELLGGDSRAVVVAADNDAVGRRGAEELARILGSTLAREVGVLPPLPPGIKDLRQFVASFYSK